MRILIAIGFSILMNSPWAIAGTKDVHACEYYLSWFQSAKPTAAVSAKIEAQIDKLNKKENGSADSLQARRAFVEGRQLLEDMMQDLSSGMDGYAIKDKYGKYVTDAAVQVAKVTVLAKEIHDWTPAQRRDRPQEFQDLLNTYQHESEVFGQLYSRYVMVVEALISVSNGRGLLDVKRAPRSPNPDDPFLAESQKVVFNLTNSGVIKNATVALDALDKEIARQSLPDLAVPEGTPEEDIVPYPALQVAVTAFKNNPFARLANRRWSLARQNYSSRPWVAMAYFVADVLMTGIEKFPKEMQPFLRTISGLGQTDALSARYMGDLIKIADMTRFLDRDGNMAVTQDEFLVGLQVRRLMDQNAKGVSDEEMITLIRVLYLSGDIWPAMVKEVSRQAKDGGPSSLAANLLKNMQNAEKKAQGLREIPFTTPRATGLALRVALVQFVEWGLLVQLPLHWQFIQDHLAPLMPWLSHL